MPSASAPDPTPRRRASLAVAAAFLALAGLGCVDHNTSAPLYVFDGGNGNGGTVYEWDDVNKVQAVGSGGTSDAANRSITGSFSGASAPLGWGGMVLDESADMLYLVFQDGTGYVIKKVGDQSGSISGTDNIISFTLDNSASTFSTGSFFGQVSLNSSSHTLYVMETAQDGSSCRVWYVPNINSIVNGATFTTSQTFNVSGDKWGAGIAATGAGTFYGLFGYGNTVYDALGNSYSGERLRLGSGTSFPSANTQVLVGDQTQMNTSSTSYGSLAYDAQNALLYCFVKPVTVATPQVLVFTPSQFTIGTPNQAPKTVMSDAALANLRILAHPPYNDWMAGADLATAGTTSSSSGTGGSTLRLWKDPSSGAASIPVTLSGVTEIRGVAFGPTSN